MNDRNCALARQNNNLKINSLKRELPGEVLDALWNASCLEARGKVVADWKLVHKTALMYPES
jgi:hypothetical protein